MTAGQNRRWTRERTQRIAQHARSIEFLAWKMLKTDHTRWWLLEAASDKIAEEFERLGGILTEEIDPELGQIDFEDWKNADGGR